MSYQRRADYIRPAALRLVPALRLLVKMKERPDYEHMADVMGSTPNVIRQHVHYLRKLGYVERYP